MNSCFNSSLQLYWKAHTKTHTYTQRKTESSCMNKEIQRTPTHPHTMLNREHGWSLRALCSHLQSSSSSIMSACFHEMLHDEHVRPFSQQVGKHIIIILFSHTSCHKMLTYFKPSERCVSSCQIGLFLTNSLYKKKRAISWKTYQRPVPLLL